MFGIGGGVLALLLWLHGCELAAGLDFRDYDDLVRSVLARVWVREPYFLTGDGYWPTLPAILRGAFLGLFSPQALPRPELALFLIRLVTIGMLWGGWQAAARITRLLGGGRLAVVLLTSFFLFNGGAIHFAASAYSEPDGMFYLLVALLLALGCLDGECSARRFLGIGLALAAGCLTRYEAWSFPFVFAAVLVWAGRRAPRPLWRWAGLVLPFAAIAVWLGFQAARLGDPFHFVKIGRSYNHLGASLNHLPGILAGTVRKLLAIHPVWVPIAVVGGGWEIWRRRREPRIVVVGLMALVLLFWALFRLWSQQMTIRFVWDATLLMAIPGALALERWLGALRPRVGGALAAVLIILNAGVFVWMFGRLEPYVPGALRQFARTVQERTEGRILLCDHLDFAQAPDLQVFRLAIRNERIVQSDWLGGGEAAITPEAVKAQGIGYVLGRRTRPALGLGEPVMSANGAGWKLWEMKRDHGPGAGSKE